MSVLIKGSTLKAVTTNSECTTWMLLTVVRRCHATMLLVKMLENFNVSETWQCKIVVFCSSHFLSEYVILACIVPFCLNKPNQIC